MPARISTASTSTAIMGAAFRLPRDLLRLFRFVVAIAETSYRVYHNRIFFPRHPFSTGFTAFFQRMKLTARSVRLGGEPRLFSRLRAAAVRSPKGDRDILFRKRPPLLSLKTLYLSIVENAPMRCLRNTVHPPWRTSVDEGLGLPWASVKIVFCVAPSLPRAAFPDSL